MINCPNCGTENRDHSKFCNECGHPLGQGAGVTCTMCGAKNAPDSVVCGECGARLVPLEGATEETIMAQVAAPDAAPLSETPADAGLPDWLEGLRDAAQHGVTGETKDLSAQDEPLDEDFLPTILPDTTPKDAYQVSEESEPAEDWLSRLRKAAPPMEAEEALPTPGPFVEEPEESPVGGISAPFEAVQDEAEDLPDWLSELRNGLRKEEELEAAPAPEIPAEPAPAERDTGGLSWLDEVVLGDVIPATPEEEYEAPAADIRGEPAPGGAVPEPDVEKAPIFSAESDTLPGELDSWDNEQLPPLEHTAEIPDWLKEMGPFDGKSEMPDALPGTDAALDAATLPPPDIEQGEVPDWLTPAAAEETEVIEDAGQTEDAEAAGLARAEIPDWLAAMRPDADAASRAEIEPEEGDIEQEGILAGLHDIIPIELSMATPPDTAHLGGLLGVLPEDEEGAERFAQIIERIAPARPVRHQKVRRFSPWRVVLALALVLLITIPMVTDIRFFGDAPTTAGTVDSVWTQIGALAPGDAVVVAYDFDPSTAGEMEPLADTLIDHLMQRQVRIIAVSLLPAGPAVAQRSMERVSELHPNYAYGGLYLNLGYLPGKEAALRSFLADPFGAGRIDYTTGEDASTLVGLTGLSTLDDVTLIVELASAQDTVRWWVEQIGSQTDVPLVAGVSAAVEPQIRPYYESTSPQIEGLVSGLAGAAEYGVLIAGRRVSTGEIEALSWATAFILLVIVAGIVISPFVRQANGSKS